MKALQLLVSTAALLAVFVISTFVRGLVHAGKIVDATFWLAACAVLLLTALVVRGILQDLSGKRPMTPEAKGPDLNDSLKEGKTG